MPFELDTHRPDALTQYLQDHGLLAADDVVHALAAAGDGNMNLTLRATTSAGTLIVKQSRPWVQKYPTIPAPEGRAEVEAAFYAVTASHPAIAHAMPQLRLHDPSSHLLVFEDLGALGDYSDAYADARIEAHDVERLLAWLDALHHAPIAPTALLANRAMRVLNHAHIYDLPFRVDADWGLDGIVPGLAEVAAEVAADGRLVARIHALGDAYLADGPRLLHGDFYPGSWLRSPEGPRIIDPEFAYLGDPTFDHGVLAAHLWLTGHAGASRAVLARTPRARPQAGVEILRRLLGVAQLPLTADLATRRAWVHDARTWILEA